MNKLFKLPIFLGVVGGLCAGLLAGINALTQPIIEKAEASAKAEGYLAMFNNANLTAASKDNIVAISANDLSDELFNAGCTGMATCDPVNGAVYDFTVKGFGGNFSFQVGFANGVCIGYTDIANTESNQGTALIKAISGKGEASTLWGISSTTDFVNGKRLNIADDCGSSYTGGPIAKCLNAAAADYNTRF